MEKIPYKYRNHILFLFIKILIFVLIFGSYPNHGVSSSFKTLDLPLQPETPNRIEVLAFFSYICVHCGYMDPLLESWSKYLPEHVVLKRVPIAFNPSMKVLQQLYYTLQSLNKIDDLHSKVFQAIFDQKEYLFDYKSIKEWVKKQDGVDFERFDSVFNSFSVKMQMERADYLARYCKVRGIPMFLVAGKYITSPAMAGNSYSGVIFEIERFLSLIQLKSLGNNE